METLTEQPRKIFRITKENAHELQQKGLVTRRERQAKLEAEAKLGRNATPQCERIAKQLDRIETMMDKEKDADTLQKLSAAHARLFNAWQVLTGTPNPGSRRVKSGAKQASVALTSTPDSVQ